MIAELIGGSPESFRGFIDSEISRWAEVVKATGVSTNK